MKITPFSKTVIHLIQSIPKGKVATYGQIAWLAGNPKGAHGVSWLLHTCGRSHNLPWQRVINSQGKISFAFASDQYVRQKKLLQKEGIIFVSERIYPLHLKMRSLKTHLAASLRRKILKKYSKYNKYSSVFLRIFRRNLLQSECLNFAS